MFQRAIESVYREYCEQNSKEQPECLDSSPAEDLVLTDTSVWAKVHPNLRKCSKLMQFNVPCCFKLCFTVLGVIPVIFDRIVYIIFIRWRSWVPWKVSQRKMESE